MNWQDLQAEHPTVVLLVGGTLTLVFVGTVTLATIVVFIPAGCEPVAYGPAASFSSAETTNMETIQLTVTVTETSGTITADHLVVKGPGIDERWAALDGVENDSVVLESGANVTVSDLEAGDEIRLVWLPDPAFDAPDRPDHCGDGMVKSTIAKHTVGENRSSTRS